MSAYFYCLDTDARARGGGERVAAASAAATVLT
jgi:hypothetical protein